MLSRILEHPLTRGMDLNDPATTLVRLQIIREKAFLRAIHDEWYSFLAEVTPSPDEINLPALELGSGAGYLDEVIPNLITSELFATPQLDLVADATRLPIRDASLRAVLMVDVLHHIPDVGKFFDAASRTVVTGGVMAMVEPWATRWSTWVYQNLHHEPFRPDSEEWSFATTGPLSGANGAIPWMVFERDRALFEQKYPQWRIEGVEPFMPFRYLMSGGVSMRSLMPGFTIPFWRAVERTIEGKRGRAGMFARIVARRVG
ncbi:MAG: methyltransferase domain-containing protein [Actinomycetota bacterium]|nr:methyltransferase domain-containing protein [Actinomycetota bacterium]